MTQLYTFTSSIRILLESTLGFFPKMRLVPVKLSRGKTKKEITLPCLELLAVTISVRAADFVTKQLHIPLLKRTIWIDSTCILFRLKTDKPIYLFGEKTVKKTQMHIDLSCYVKTTLKRIDSWWTPTIRPLVKSPTVAYIFSGYMATMESSTEWYNGGAISG